MVQNLRTSTLCDLTQSYASLGGGGVGTYLAAKRQFIADHTDHRLIQIVPGACDKIVANGRHVWVEIEAPRVKGSENYRFILNTRKVREVLGRYRPDLIECQCPWVLPWTAINYRKANPDVALVAGYHTDFPNVHLRRMGDQLRSPKLGDGLARLGQSYAYRTYREFDRVYALDEATRHMLAGCNIDHVDVLNLGVDTQLFSPERRDTDGFRRELGIGVEHHGPLLVYAGRLDHEKRAAELVDMFGKLPKSLGASLVLFGDGRLRTALESATQGLPVFLPGYLADRSRMARALASSDIYVSAMADETFGLSVIEAQSCGLPVVGVAAGAMVRRVPPGLGFLGPVGDTSAMARNVVDVWHGDTSCMRRDARNHAALHFDWNGTFERLLGIIYPKALASAAQRCATTGAADDRAKSVFDLVE